LATLRKVQISAPGGDVCVGEAQRPAYSVVVSEEEAKTAKAAFFDDKARHRYIPEKDKFA